ncbi:MAG: DUF4136 domain-containing protein [Proteobacteria bacterium]|jgi:hypothetical protein|nr:DUF4136 domain-containing protein [Pseudomonadota bacterium]
MSVLKQKTVPLAVLAILVSACAASVNVDYDQSYDFAKVKTFTIVDHPTKKSGNPQIDNELIAKRVVAAISKNMSAKGYTATADNPDVKVDYFITQKTGISASQSSVSFGLGRYGSHGGVGMGYTVPVGEAQTYEEGTLTINIVNTKDNALLWTGSSSQILGENQTPETIDQNINNIVSTILAKFPPGGKK